jgi:hypothetical protein
MNQKLCSRKQKCPIKGADPEFDGRTEKNHETFEDIRNANHCTVKYRVPQFAEELLDTARKKIN